MKKLLLIYIFSITASQVAWSAVTCSMGVGTINFGNYSPFLASPLDSTGTITITCSGGGNSLVEYNILLSRGGSSSYSPRQMFSGTNSINYNLYTTSARVIIWGDNTGGTSIVSDSYRMDKVGVTREYTIFGRIPSRQNIPPGVFEDIITITVNY